MKKLLNWLLEPYSFGQSELKHLKRIYSEASGKKKKIRLLQLRYFNILLLVIYSFLVIMSITYIVLIVVHWLVLLGLFFTIPFMILIKKIQKKLYDFKNAYIEKNKNLIKYY